MLGAGCWAAKPRTDPRYRHPEGAVRAPKDLRPVSSEIVDRSRHCTRTVVPTRHHFFGGRNEKTAAVTPAGGRCHRHPNKEERRASRSVHRR